MRHLYNLVILLYAVFSLPKFLKKKWEGGGYAPTLKELLGFTLRGKGTESIWIHAVSVGEVKVAATLLPYIQKNFPEKQLIVTCATKTGVERAQTTFPQGTICTLLPLDISWIMRKIVRMVRPTYLFVSESDFWFNFLQEAKRSGTKIYLINGKISNRSLLRYKRAAQFSQQLFGAFDRIMVQSEEYKARFLELLPGASVSVTGNMKYDVLPIATPFAHQHAITFGSTHKEEEEQLLRIVHALHTKHPEQKIYFVPRHPERFTPVAQKMDRLHLHFARWSDQVDAPIILVDTMGKLVSLYAESLLSIVAGSFDPTLQGHDIFEPILCESIPLFGPYMSSQNEMMSAILGRNAGYQVETSLLQQTIEDLLSNNEEVSRCRTAGQKLLKELRGGAERTWDIIFPKKVALSEENV